MKDFVLGWHLRISQENDLFFPRRFFPEEMLSNNQDPKGSFLCYNTFSQKNKNYK
jgi:hypothetical protein